MNPMPLLPKLPSPGREHALDSMSKTTGHSSSGDSTSSLLTCPICQKQLTNPHMLPCLHVFCLACLRDECQGKARDKYFCPACVWGDQTGDIQQKSQTSREWHSFEKILEQETGNEELQRRLAELPATENIMESWENNGDADDSPDTEEHNPDRKSSILEPPVLFPCTIHPDRMADTFCSKCAQIACQKCVSSFHRRCQTFSNLQEAVDAKRGEFASVHDNMASNLIACEDVVDFQQKRLQAISEMRTNVLVQIKKFRTDIVNSVLAKEKALTLEANQLMDTLTAEANDKNKTAEKLSQGLRRQMELLDLSFSVKSEAELLPFLPDLVSRIENDSNFIIKQYSDPLSKITFKPDHDCKSTLDASALGEIHVEGQQSQMTSSLMTTSDDVTGSQHDLQLSLVTSFHGGTRDDITAPLLTDLIVVANGDVILTDRDNKCVKKFNQTGKLLTRVVIDAVPSRIATVSHARAVVSVMNKRSLYFLSLFGTVRVLHTVKVKKLYSFLTSLGNGILAAGTNLCESIDLLNENGETIRSIYTQKPDKASISRPLYLTPTLPLTSVKFGTKDSNDNKSNDATDNSNSSSSSSSSSNSNNLITDSGNAATSRRQSINNNNINNNNINSNAIPSTSTSSSKTRTSKISKKSTKTNQCSNSKKSSSLSVVTATDSSTSTTSKPPSPPTFPEDAILVSDSGKRVVFRLDKEGNVNYTLRSNDQLRLECPLGITVHETGMTLVADRDSDSVLLLDKGGNFLKKILTLQDGLVKPCAIYADGKGGVALSQVDGTVKIYKNNGR